MSFPTFYDKLFNPLSIGRSNDDFVDFGGSTVEKGLFLLASVVLGVFTAGIFHVGHELLHHYYWKDRNVTNSNPSEFTVNLPVENPTIKRNHTRNYAEDRASKSP